MSTEKRRRSRARAFISVSVAVSVSGCSMRLPRMLPVTVQWPCQVPSPRLPGPALNAHQHIEAFHSCGAPSRRLGCVLVSTTGEKHDESTGAQDPSSIIAQLQSAHDATLEGVESPDTTKLPV